MPLNANLVTKTMQNNIHTDVIFERRQFTFIHFENLQSLMHLCFQPDGERRCVATNVLPLQQLNICGHSVHEPSRTFDSRFFKWAVNNRLTNSIYSCSCVCTLFLSFVCFKISVFGLVHQSKCEPFHSTKSLEMYEPQQSQFKLLRRLISSFQILLSWKSLV